MGNKNKTKEQLLRELTELLKTNAELKNSETTLKGMVNELKEELQLFKTLIDNVPSPMFYKDTKGVYLGCNKAFEELYSMKREEIVGKSVINLMPDREQASVHHNTDIELVKNPGKKIYESCTTLANGITRTYIDYKSTFTKPDGTTAGLVGISIDITELKRIEEQLMKVNRCFLSFTTNASENVNNITQLCGEVLGAVCALYNRLDGGLLCSIGQWNVPPDHNPADKADGHICYDVIQRGGDDIFIVRDLPHSKYFKTDPNVALYNLKTYMGKAVKIGNTPIGSLCVVYQRDFVPGKFDRSIMEILASAIGIEEERRVAEESLDNEKTRFMMLSENAPFGIAMIDNNGQYTYVNPKFTEIFGYDLNDIPDGKTWFRKAYPDTEYRHTVITRWKGDLEKAKPGEQRPVVFTVTCKDGSKKVINFIPVTLETVGTIVAFEDITERTRALEALQQSEKRMTDIIDYLPDATFVINKQGTVIAWNKAIEEMTGVMAKDMVGKGKYEYGIPFYKTRRPILVDLVLSPEDETIEKRYPLVKRDKDILYTELFISTFGKNGAYLWAKAKPLYDPEGNVVGAIETIRDVTERREIEQTLRIERERFEILAESAPFGLALMDKNGTIKYINQKHKTLFGYDISEIPDGRTWFRKAYPDQEYRKTVIGEWVHTVESSQLGEQFPKVFTTTCKDGTKKIAKFMPVKLETGEILATCEDITERTVMEENLKKAYKTTQDITDNAPFGIYVIDETGKIEYINNAMLEISGATQEQLIGKNLLNLPTYREIGLSERFQRGLKGEPFTMESVRYISYYGKKETIRNFIGIPLEQEGVRKLLVIVEDITKQKRLEEELKGLSLKDELTGLYNRRGFFTLAEQHLKIADRVQKKVVLIFSDLDNMKWINDNLGHTEGDNALIDASSILKETFRESDIIARIGGDEFVVFALETQSDKEEYILNRLEHNINRHNEQARRKFKVSISTGISHYDPDAPCSIDELLSESDKLMYEMKRIKQKT